MNQGLVAQRARHAYQSAQVSMDDPMGLVVKLYDGMIGFLRRGAESMAQREHAQSSEAIRRAADIVGELQAVLNLEQGGEVAANLDRIYSYCRRRIMEAHMQKAPEGLNEIADLLAPLRDAWAEARVKQMSELR